MDTVVVHLRVVGQPDYLIDIDMIPSGRQHSWKVSFIRIGGIDMHGNFVVVSGCLQSDVIAPFPVIFHLTHVGFPVFGCELPVPIRLAPQLVDGCSAAFCVALLVTVEQLVCQRPKLAVAISLNLCFHHAAFAQALRKRRIHLLLTRMCVLLYLTLMLVLSKPILEDPLVLLIVIIICFISNTTEFHETPDRIVLVLTR